MKWIKVFMVLVLALGLGTFAGCSDDDDGSPTDPGNGGGDEAWVGTWVSEGDDIAPILVSLFNYDRVVVQMNDNGTVALTTRISGGATSTTNGTYAVTESASGSVHSIQIVYPAFTQEGIIEVVDNNPFQMRLEVVQTVPDIGATVPTVEEGFGADPTLGDSNIQVYANEDAIVGTWLSEGENIAPILVSLFNYDRVQVVFGDNGTVALTTRVSGGAETTTNGTYALDESPDGGKIYSIDIIYPAFEQGGIVEIDAGLVPNELTLEAVQTVPDIGATRPTPAEGFGADPTLGTSNIQVYVRVVD